MPNKAPTPILDRMRDDALKHAESILIGKPGAELMPVWLIEAKNGERTVIGSSFGSVQAKAVAIATVKEVMQGKEAVRFSFVTEAWIARLTPEQWAKDKRRPTDRPDRIEAIMIITGDLGGQRTTGYQIIRDDNGVVKELAFMEEHVDPAEGAMANMLEGAFNG